MKFSSEVSLKIRTAIKVKLAELGNDVYEELPDYIMVMVANRKSEEQMTESLYLFLGDNTQQFTTWLHSLLSKLQSVASVSTTDKRASVSIERSENAGATNLTHSDSESEHSHEDASCAIPSSDETSKVVLEPEEEEQSNSPKSDSSSVELDRADSTSSSRESNNEPSLNCDTDSFKTENSKTENGTPEKVVKKRKKHSVTRVFRVKSRKLDSESDSSKSNTSVGTVSSSNRTTEHGSDASDSENETKSYAQIRKMKQSNNTSSEVSSSVLKTENTGSGSEKMEGEDLVQSKYLKEKDSEENNDLDSEETRKTKLRLKRL